MYSTQNEGKFVNAEKFVRTLKFASIRPQYQKMCLLTK